MEYKDFPPIHIFTKVLHNCPQTAILYASLYKIKKKSLRISVRRNEVKRRFLITPTIFRNNLLSLGRLGILTFEETSDYYLIDFFDIKNA